MTTYVCTELASTQTGQTCVSWAEQSSMTDSFAITQAQASQISGAILLVLAIAWGFKTLSRQLR